MNRFPSVFEILPVGINQSIKAWIEKNIYSNELVRLVVINEKMEISHLNKNDFRISLIIYLDFKKDRYHPASFSVNFFISKEGKIIIVDFHSSSEENIEIISALKENFF